jgi:polar amino acid transport system substrate-binding protein
MVQDAAPLQVDDGKGDAVVRTWLRVVPAVLLALGATACVESSTPTDSVAGQPRLVQSGQLTTCSHLPYVPFQFRDSDKTVGFDVDLVDLVAKRLGVKQAIVDTAWEGIQSGADLNAGQCDVVAGAISITPTRRQNFDFSDSYFHATQALLARAGVSYPTLDALRGKKVGVQNGTTGADYVKSYTDRNPGSLQVVNFEDSALEETAVKTGQVDAAINDNGIFYDYAKKNPDTQVTAEFDTNDQYGFGVRKGNKPLLDAVNAALADSVRDGSYARIYAAWFGKQPTWLPGAASPSSAPTSSSHG